MSEKGEEKRKTLRANFFFRSLSSATLPLINSTGAKSHPLIAAPNARASRSKYNVMPAPPRPTGSSGPSRTWQNRMASVPKSPEAAKKASRRTFIFFAATSLGLLAVARTDPIGEWVRARKAATKTEQGVGGAGVKGQS